MFLTDYIAERCHNLFPRRSETVSSIAKCVREAIRVKVVNDRDKNTDMEQNSASPFMTETGDAAPVRSTGIGSGRHAKFSPSNAKRKRTTSPTADDAALGKSWAAIRAYDNRRGRGTA